MPPRWRPAGAQLAAGGWRLAAGGVVSLASAAYLQLLFGENTAQSANSGNPKYRPAAGLRGARANLALTYLFNRRNRLTTAVSVSALQGDARNSPLVRQATTASGEMLLSHAF